MIVSTWDLGLMKHGSLSCRDWKWGKRTDLEVRVQDPVAPHEIDPQAQQDGDDKDSQEVKVADLVEGGLQGRLLGLARQGAGADEEPRGQQDEKGADEVNAAEHLVVGKVLSGSNMSRSVSTSFSRS